ncbi:MAG: hypothetical protein QN189_04860 [Armatimonadota bacterium]|nr:hypothetical protein [Armatimonadota bacterium]
MEGTGFRLRAIPGKFVHVRIPASLEPTMRRVAARLHAPFFVSFVGGSTTLIVLEEEWELESKALPGAQAERGFSLLSLESPQGRMDVETLRRSQDWLLSRLSDPAPEVLWLSSFHRDYLLAREEDVPRILAALGEDPTTPSTS